MKPALLLWFVPFLGVALAGVVVRDGEATKISSTKSYLTATTPLTYSCNASTPSSAGMGPSSTGTGPLLCVTGMTSIIPSVSKNASLPYSWPRLKTSSTFMVTGITPYSTLTIITVPSKPTNVSLTSVAPTPPSDTMQHWTNSSRLHTSTAAYSTGSTPLPHTNSMSPSSLASTATPGYSPSAGASSHSKTIAPSLSLSSLTIGSTTLLHHTLSLSTGTGIYTGLSTADPYPSANTTSTSRLVTTSVKTLTSTVISSTTRPPYI